MGMEAFSINNPMEVEGTLKKTFMMDGPVLISVSTDPNALAMPPKIEFEQLKGFALSMSKLIMKGQISQVIDTIKSNANHIREIF
ncbi:hypothetical protein JCM30204_13570 [Dysgonomonas termitidis]